MKNLINYILLMFLIGIVSCKHTELAFPLDARRITKEYISKPHKADRKYKKRILVIEGRVSQVYKNKNEQTVLILANVKDKAGVSCTLKLSQKITAPFRQYQLVEIRGFCLGFNKNVILENCVILNK